jgi:glycosyltransferase involved in cell wall biosynthesis
MQEEKDISVIIPVFNAESCIGRLITEVHHLLNSSGKSFEVIVVDDNSKDHSWQIIKDTCKELPHTKAFCLAKNFGQHKATLCGFSNCSGNIVITLDDDFEHAPKDILALYDSITTTGKDVVYGIPSNAKKKSLTRKVITYLYKSLSKVENPYAGIGSSFRALKKDLVQNIISHYHHLFVVDELILWYTASIGVYQTPFHVSQKSTSGYSYQKLFFLGANVMMLSTTLPLKLVKAFGIIMSCTSFFIGFIYFMRKIIFKTPAGYTSIIVSVLFSTGLILLCLAIIGQYLGNVLMMQSNKPPFYVKEKV